MLEYGRFLLPGMAVSLDREWRTQGIDVLPVHVPSGARAHAESQARVAQMTRWINDMAKREKARRVREVALRDHVLLSPTNFSNVHSCAITLHNTRSTQYVVSSSEANQRFVYQFRTSLAIVVLERPDTTRQPLHTRLEGCHV
jgi:hypothetical protein